MTPNPASPGSASPRRIVELDGLRGIAILLVVVFHFGSVDPLPDTPLAAAWHSVIRLGWTGVDLFFVLSGCLITGILLDTRDSPHYFQSFYARRVLRILPLYYAAVAFFFWIYLPLAHALVARGSYTTGPESWMRSSAWEQAWYWLHVSNWRSAFGYLEVSPVAHFWSLAIEEQFYLFWPLVVRVNSEKRLLKFCAIVIGASLVCRNLPYLQLQQAQHPAFLYRLTPFRLDGLLLGSCIPLLARLPALRKAVKTYLLPGSIVGCIVFAGASWWAGNGELSTGPMTRFGYSALALICFAVVFVTIDRAGSDHWLTTPLRAFWLRRIGEISYGIYVINLLIAAVIHGACRKLMPGPEGYAMRSMVSLAAGFSASYLLAAVSWRFLERPFLRMKHRFSY